MVNNLAGIFAIKVTALAGVIARDVRVPFGASHAAVDAKIPITCSKVEPLHDGDY